MGTAHACRATYIVNGAEIISDKFPAGLSGSWSAICGCAFFVEGTPKREAKG